MPTIEELNALRDAADREFTRVVNDPTATDDDEGNAEEALYQAEQALENALTA